MEEESISHLNSHLARHLELVEGQTCDPVKVRDNSGLVREGYKKTNLGWIPEEWEIKSLDDIGDFSKGKGISRMEISSSGKPCIRYAEIYTKYDFYTEHLESYVSEESALNSREISYGDLLFAGSGETLEDIGKCVAYLGKEDAFAGGDIVILRPKKEHARYLGFLLNHSVANRQKYKLGQGHSVVHIYSSGLKKLKVPLPPIKEQQKIATILSTWDRAIAKQEQLIIAKQEFKKGLMQLLLTGKKRFEGFEGEWELKFLSDIMTIGNGRDYKHLSPGDIPVYGTGGIMRYVNDYLFDGESVGIGRKGTIDKPVFLQGKFWTVDTLFYCHSFKESLALYVYYLFLTINWKNYNEASGVPSLSQNTIKKIKVSLPSVKEQQKIASVLSAADKEIGLLQSELATFRGQKRGLMQRLLTGEVRVRTI